MPTRSFGDIEMLGNVKLEKKAHKIADDYIYNDMSYISLMNKYSLASTRDVRCFIDYAIIHVIVSYDETIKAHEVSLKHRKFKQDDINKHYKELMDRRAEWIANNVITEGTIKIAAINYANGMNKESICRKFNFESTQVVDYALKRAIVTSIVSDEIMEKISETVQKDQN